MSNRAQQRERAILMASIVFLLFAMLVSGRAWLQRATAPAPRSHAVLRLSVPGYDIGADAIPAREGEAGYVEFWIGLLDADEYYRPLLQLPGAPALPVAPKLRPAPRLGEITA
jgi:hypothetical protein